MGLLVAIGGPRAQIEIVRYDWIPVGLVLGSVIGAPIAIYMPMTAVPQRTASSHMCGALAATLVGVAEYWRLEGHVPHAGMAALGVEGLFGSLTITGRFMAFGKLQTIVKRAPATIPRKNATYTRTSSVPAA